MSKPKPGSKTREVVRSAITGEFEKPIKAKTHPNTTITQKVKVPSKRKSKGK